jgi:23S rRNA pseudouridine2605 synthase
LAEGFAKPRQVRVKSEHKKSTTLEIVLDEGRNREIRRLLARIGHKVLRLKRTALGPLRLGELPPGGVRPVTREEIRKLRMAASGSARRGKGPRSASRPKTRQPRASDRRPAKKKTSQFGTVIGGGA